jgi:hypothetical protein
MNKKIFSRAEISATEICSNNTSGRRFGKSHFFSNLKVKWIKNCTSFPKQTDAKYFCFPLYPMKKQFSW